MMKTKRAKDEHVPRRSRTKGRTQERVTVVADPHRMMMLCGGAVRQRDEVLYKPSSVESKMWCCTSPPPSREERVLGGEKGWVACCRWRE
jgi:hypothetical protein